MLSPRDETKSLIFSSFLSKKSLLIFNISEIPIDFSKYLMGSLKSYLMWDLYKGAFE